MSLWRQFQGLFAWLVPPLHAADWPLIPYQPLLFASLWVWSMLHDLAHIEPPIPAPPILGLMPHLGTVLMLACPPQALLASILISKARGTPRYWGLWFRTGADMGILCTLVLGNYHSLLAATLTASIVFVPVIVIRDVWTLMLSEHVAGKIRRDGV